MGHYSSISVKSTEKERTHILPYNTTGQIFCPGGIDFYSYLPESL
jgi:hypothetical protein